MGRAATALVLGTVLLVACQAIGTDDVGSTADPRAPSTSSTDALEIRSRCDQPGAVEGDVDGDGQLDSVYHLWVAGEGAVLGVCTAAGLEDQIEGKGMAEVLIVLDIEADGRSEIFYGGTTVAAAGTNVAVVDGDQLREVVDDDGAQLLLWDGVLARNDEGDIAESATWGCQDIDGDRENELVSVSVEFTNAAHWTRDAYELTGNQAALLVSSSGTNPLPINRIDFAATLTHPGLEA